MTVIAEIPLSPSSKTFEVVLANVTYAMAVTWRDPYGWFLDIALPDGTKLLSGLPLIAAVDLLQPFPQYQFGGELFVFTDGDPTANPTVDNLGIASHLYFATPS